MPPFERLDATHAQLLRHLDALGVLIERLGNEGADAIARHSARELHDFFERTARPHHADEERHVFPRLLEGAEPELVQHILRLQQDHGWLEQDWLELAPALEAIADGHSGWDPDDLRHSVRVFRALYCEHIALEESVIYPMAKRQAGAALD
jgi:hemerythrin-like domain-containing protein